MKNQMKVNPWWAALTAWGVVNAVNILQAAGFLSRVLSKNMQINQALGYVMIALVVPAGLALAAFWRARAGWRHWIGLTIYLAFIGLMLVVDYLWPVEFRSPARLSILVPYLVLFFGSIFWMGLPMYRMNRRLWLVTAITTILLLVAMLIALRAGVG